MVHPRLYWGHVGNDLTPALLELPISDNHRPDGWQAAVSFSELANTPISANRTYAIFNQNGWGRSLHFLAAWFLVVTGAFYVIAGILTGHIWRDLLPRARELAPPSVMAGSEKPFTTAAGLGRHRTAIRFAAEVRVRISGVHRAAVDGGHGTGDVTCGCCGLSNTVGFLWRLSVGADGAFFRILRAALVPRHPRGDGDLDRIPPAVAGNDSGGLICTSTRCPAVPSSKG